MWKNTILILSILFSYLFLEQIYAEEPKEQKILFEIEHINYAWGYHHSGTYIDNEGNVFEYDHSYEGWYSKTGYNPPDEGDGSLTGQQLLEKIGDKKNWIGKIEKKELLDKIKLIPDASKGILSDPGRIAYDAGSTEFRAYLYLDAEDKYIPISLKKRGASSRENLSESGKKLYQWLEQVATRF